MNINNIIQESFATTYSVELLYEDTIELDFHLLLQKFKERITSTEILLKTERITTFMIKDVLVDNNDDSIPLQFMIINEGEVVNEERLEKSLSQTWDWVEAKEAIKKVKSTIVISDFMASSLDYKLRVDVFNTILRCFLEVYKPNAINWLYSQKVVDPSIYLESFTDKEKGNIYGHINVRYFKGNDDDIVMDTLGLAAIGLPDIQCHFKSLDYGLIAMHLFDYAKEVYNSGDLYIDGQERLFKGLEISESLQHEVSLANPARVVLDINLGEKYSGRRD